MREKKHQRQKQKKKWKKAARTTVNANALQCAAHNDSKVDTALLYWLKQNSPNAYGLANNKKKLLLFFVIVIIRSSSLCVVLGSSLFS